MPQSFLVAHWASKSVTNDVARFELRNFDDFGISVGKDYAHSAFVILINCLVICHLPSSRICSYVGYTSMERTQFFDY